MDRRNIKDYMLSVVYLKILLHNDNVIIFYKRR